MENVYRLHDVTSNVMEGREESPPNTMPVLASNPQAINLQGPKIQGSQVQDVPDVDGPLFQPAILETESLRLMLHVLGGVRFQLSLSSLSPLCLFT